MMAAAILIFSVAALLQFFVSYCRSLIAASSKEQLSIEVRDVAGIAKQASGDDFRRVMQLLRLCPDLPEENGSIRAVSAYFQLLGFTRSTVARLIPSITKWTEMERAHCAYFAAVALDRRIAFSRELLAQQMDT